MEESVRKEMNYLQMIKKKNPKKVALIHDGISYTYGELVDKAIKLSKDFTIFSGDFKSTGNKRKLHIIQKKGILDQLLEFLACNERDLVPLLIPYDRKFIPQNIDIPNNACMAVASSGTSGVPKILFRTYKSWADFFPIQNKIFGIRENSRFFVQGSLAFTGNLNLYMAVFSVGATLIAQNHFAPKEWIKVIEKEHADGIYLIPSKLMCILKAIKKENKNIITILSGSESLGKEEADSLKKYFPQAKVILYYGASELSYITYITDNDMTSKKNLVGKPFPKVSVFVKKGEIFVDTPYHAEGISCPCTLKDKGYIDENGNLYFSGRSDDIVNIHGRKLSIFHIEEELNHILEIKESAVILFMQQGHSSLIAFVCLEDYMKIELEESLESSYFLGKIKREFIIKRLKEYLMDFELPDKIVVIREMPRNESGKIDKKKIKQEWELFNFSDNS